MSASRVETIIDTLVAEYGAITVASGYRNTLTGKVVHGIKAPDRIPRDVEIGIDFNGEPISVEDDQCSSFESRIDTYVQATVKCGTNEAANFTLTESILTDIKRCTALIIKKYLHASSNYWNIDVSKGVTAYRDVIEIPNKPIRIVGVKYTIHIRNLTVDFT